MPSEKELEQLARDLINGISPWFKGNSVNVLQAFIREEGRCVYCGKELWKVYGIASCGDHLLPRSMYPDLEQNPDNLVPACAECNSIKGAYDPSDKKGMERAITEEVRLEFIRKCKAEIDRKTQENGWRKEFESAKVLFWEAVEKYRKRKKKSD